MKRACMRLLAEREKAPFYTTEDSPGNGTQEPIHGNIQPRAKFMTNSSHDSGFADTHHLSPNGWMQRSPCAGESLQLHTSNGTYHQEKDTKSSWSGCGIPETAFAYPEGVSRSLTGSSDSLLSDGSATNQKHLSYQQQTFNGSQPSLPPKESSQRNSRRSVRTTSTGSGYLGGASQISPFSQTVSNRDSRLSAYDKHGSQQLHYNGSSDDGGISTPTSGRTSSSSISDIERLAHEISQSNLSGTPSPKFIKDTTSYWYKPEITRDQAHTMLKNKPPGSFVVRDSRCYPGAFGLAMKVHQVPAAVLVATKPEADMNNELVRHFLIEPSTKGVRLKGCAMEPVFGSLSALICQHSIKPMALPCKLIIPTDDQEVQGGGLDENNAEVSNTAAELLRQGAACNVLYLGSAETESLTGPEAIERAMREITVNRKQDMKTSVVHFKVSPQGITLTDNARKLFFRRHYPTATVTYCGMDPSSREPQNRRWNASKDRGPPNARVFGFVARKPSSSSDNVCHLFAELDLDQPSPAIVNFVSKVLIGTN